MSPSLAACLAVVLPLHLIPYTSLLSPDPFIALLVHFAFLVLTNDDHVFLLTVWNPLSFPSGSLCPINHTVLVILFLELHSVVALQSHHRLPVTASCLDHFLIEPTSRHLCDPAAVGVKLIFLFHHSKTCSSSDLLAFALGTSCSPPYSSIAI